MSIQFIWPFDELMMRLVETVVGSSRHTIFAERTGISERRWRDSSKQFRPARLDRAVDHAEERILSDLRDRGYGEEERLARFAKMPRSLAGQLIFASERLGEIEYPRAREFALQIDSLGKDVTEARLSNDLPHAKAVLLETAWLDQRYFAKHAHEFQESDRPALVADVESADSWPNIHRPLGAVTVNLLFSLLALWEVESNWKFFQRFQQRSVFSLLLPRALIDGEGRVLKKRGVFQLPIRRLIDLAGALAYRYREKAWPERPLSVRELTIICCRETERGFVDWRDGTTRLLWPDFERIGRYLFYRGDEVEREGSVPVLTPLFCAASLFQMLLVEKDLKGRTRSITIPSDEYSYWYERHALEQRQASAVTFGDTPWPAWLTSPY